ncbi:HepT-like ribonuclease domain-containing protein [Ramlibacter sp.]|uniref:HepT-like ribonuclease domain-containing protein n=1 Tax=Ramlibacter sp. TaxID=1917967 RepID=UPI0017B6E9EC|nr:HepT-like ribonuclease domain-containing protein [Ramlibacter sp.]MBA2674875.1 DUF86 domain-containing protein [Ramlibacter sp.]
MTDRVPKLLLDAIEASRTAREFLGAQSIEDYLADKKSRSAIERQLEILGEACGRIAKLEPAWLEALEGLRFAIGLRNRIIHGYDGIDHGIVYQTVCDDLPPLEAELVRLLDQRQA